MELLGHLNFIRNCQIVFQTNFFLNYFNVYFVHVNSPVYIL